MMSNGVDLLRLLEPAVRPGGLPAPTRDAQPPIEGRDFESLLNEAKQVQGADEANAAEATQPPDRLLLAQLSGVDMIANPDLLALMNRAPQP